MLILDQKRILLVDDNEAIHDDFRKVFRQTQVDPALKATKKALFGVNSSNPIPDQSQNLNYHLDFAVQGQEALEKVVSAVNEGKPYALAFVDIRMPPGWDGIVTIKKIWEIDPEIQIVICTAYSDYSWEEMSHHLKFSDNFLILKKPFDIIEINQLAAALTKKWELKKQVQESQNTLQMVVNKRTQELTTTNANLLKTISLNQGILETIHDGIIAIDTNQQVITFNKKLALYWNLSEKLINEAKPLEIFTAISKQVIEKDLFLETLLNVMQQNPKCEDVSKWALKNTNVVELHILPIFSFNHSNETVGLVLSFKNFINKDETIKEYHHNLLDNK